MIKIISSKKYKDLLDKMQCLEYECLKLRAALTVEKKESSSKTKIKCEAVKCTDNENGYCYLSETLVSENGLCKEFDDGSVIDELDSSVKIKMAKPITSLNK